MQGAGRSLLKFIGMPDTYFNIPVYQRKYSWKQEQCEQLLNDLKKVIDEDRETHFFGSIVADARNQAGTTNYYVIDGQQRITTISLLLLVIYNLLKQGKAQSAKSNTAHVIYQRYLSDDSEEELAFKLCPVKDDQAAYAKLYDDPSEYDLTSNMTCNYQYFYDRILSDHISVDALYAAIKKLEIICITLDPQDNPQLIFESLNSTGLALSEGDKIRNFILMNLDPSDQSKYYTRYWAKIERCTQDNVSDFVRDYLSIKLRRQPKMSDVYRVFKDYADSNEIQLEDLLEDMLLYAKLYEKILTSKSGLNDKLLDNCLFRMSWLEITVMRSYIMEVLKLNQDGKLSVDDVRKVLEIIESYLFRRNICDVPTNALNKIFLMLNREILRYDNTANNYVEKLIYALRSKTESGRFPIDEEFARALSEKQVYKMRGRYRSYLFERFENHDTTETKDIYQHLEDRDYSIEHIMPQKLTREWIEDLGVENAKEIYTEWKDRLANLTLTGYNPSLSNKTFAEKRDADTKGGYIKSGLRMNQKIATKESWGLPELKERDKEMVAEALTIWTCPETVFKPAEKQYDSCSLADEDIDLTGRDIVKYSYQGAERTVTSWADMLDQMVKYLHHRDKTILSTLAQNQDKSGLSGYVQRDPKDELWNAFQVDDHIYMEGNTNTMLKISILQRLFPLYGVDPQDLVFYLKDPDADKSAESQRHALRKEYWLMALPIIQKENAERGTFKNVKPNVYNEIRGHFGIGGFSVGCVANYDSAFVQLYFGSGDIKKNKDTFDVLYSHKDAIEASIDQKLQWHKAENNKASWINLPIEHASLMNRTSWQHMAESHAVWSKKLLEAVLPYLQTNEKKNTLGSKRRAQVDQIIRDWIVATDGIEKQMSSKGIVYLTFTTEEMSAILPDLVGKYSGWNNEKPYRYEIINRDGRHIYIKLVISRDGLTDKHLEICDKINEFYPAPHGKVDWKWRSPFRVDTFDVGGDISKERLFEKLDQSLEQIRDFEKELKEKLK